MRVALVTHPASEDHRGPPGHPERQERLDAALDGVGESGLEVVPLVADAAERGDLLAVHDEGFLDDLRAFCGAGGGWIDADTYAVAGSWQAALRGAGAGSTAARALDDDAADVALVATRPPGHHAEHDRAMGFCLLNGIAVAAAMLTGRGERVAIIDWDVHHGNGTQGAFFDDPRVLYVSLHQYGVPFYPGTGSFTEIGTGAATGTTVNIPMRAGTDGAIYAEAFSRIVAPIVAQFGPDWMLVSAGYDAHIDDPLASTRLVATDYAWMAAALAPLVGPRRTVFFLEGGYDLDAVRQSTAATLRGHGEPGTIQLPPVGASKPDQLPQIVETLAPYWDLG